MKTVKLKDLVDFSNGYAFKSTDYVEYSNTVNCRMSNIRPDGSFDVEYNIKYLPDEFAEKYKGFILNDGDIIIAMTDMAGDPKILGVPTLVNTKGYSVLMNQRVGKLTLKSKDIHPTYLKYYLMSNYARNYFKSFAGGGVQLNIGQKEILNIDIKLCDIKEQVEICNVLDKINVLIQQNSKQIEKLDQLIKSRFIEMFGTIHDNKFGYEIKTLQDVCEQIKDGTHQTPTYTDDSVNGYKFLSSKDVTTGKIDWTHLKYIPEELHNELYARIAPKKGDILLAKNGTTGIAAIVDRDEIFDIYVSLALLRPIEINSVYLWAAINSVETKQQFDSSLKGIGVPNLHLGEIKKARIIVPPIELQKQFATFVEQTDKSKLAVQQSIAELEELKKSLMQKYFG